MTLYKITDRTIVWRTVLDWEDDHREKLKGLEQFGPMRGRGSDSVQKE